jgi:hypothetical protein
MANPVRYPDPMPAPTLRPLTFGEVLDTSFNLFKRNFKTVLAISAIVMVPLAIIGALATAGLAPTDFSVLDDPNLSFEDAMGAILPLYGAIGSGLLIQLIGQILVQAATTRVYSETYQGVALGVGEGMKSGLRRLPAMIALTIVQTIATFIGLIFCLAPGVWLYTIWTVSPAALMAEERGPFGALRRSAELVKGYFWRTLGLVVVANLLVSVISSIITLPIQLAGTVGTLGDPEAVLSGGYLAIQTLVSGLVTVVTMPFVAAVVVAIYYDLRVRKEAYDLDRLIADLGDQPAALPGTSDPSNPFGLG